MNSLLQITNLHVSIEEKPILKGISMEIQEGELHAIMGPNGSGKSTLVNTLMGHPKYKVTNGFVTFKGKNLLNMTPDERARAGLFLAFQYPREIAGVTLRSFLHAAYKANQQPNKPNKLLSPIKFKKHLEQVMEELHMDPVFMERSLNEGFSGGEKKKAEIIQLKILQPTLALLDETDSGLDIDALKIVAEGIKSLQSKAFSGLLVTHYARILHYLEPNYVHVMMNGKIVESGDIKLAKRLENEGYEKHQT